MASETSEKKPSKRRKLLLGIGGGIIGLCLCSCIGFFVLGKIAESSPAVQATGTARASTNATVTMQAVAKATEAARPTNTTRPTETSTPTHTPVPSNTPTPTNTLDPKTATAQAIANNNATATAQIAQARQGTATAQTATAEAKMTQAAANATATAQVKYVTAVAQTAEANAIATVAAEAGVTKWLKNEGGLLGVRKIAWSYSLGYYRPEEGKIFLSLYIVGISNSTSEKTFNPFGFGLVDGGGEIHGQLFIEPREPQFRLCTVKPNGKCEGWWTTQIWDPCLLCSTLETQIIQRP